MKKLNGLFCPSSLVYLLPLILAWAFGASYIFCIAEIGVALDGPGLSINVPEWIETGFFWIPLGWVAAFGIVAIHKGWRKGALVFMGSPFALALGFAMSVWPDIGLWSMYYDRELHRICEAPEGNDPFSGWEKVTACQTLQIRTRG